MLSMNYHPDDTKFLENFRNIDRRETGLWVRWLWPDAVEAQEIDRELKALADAGFAGAEIGLHAMAATWGTDAYWQGLIWALRSAKKYRLKLDLFMTVGTLCLPTDVLPVDSDAAEKQLFYYDSRVSSDGRALSVRLGVPTRSKTTVNARLVAVSYAKIEKTKGLETILSEDCMGVLYADQMHTEGYDVASPSTLWGFLGKGAEAELVPYG